MTEVLAYFNKYACSSHFRGFEFDLTDNELNVLHTMFLSTVTRM